MMRSLLLAVVCFLALTAPVAAQSPAPLTVLRVTPAGEDVPAGRQIVVQFNRAVVPLGRMDRRNDEIPIQITPHTACQWRWLNLSTLACQLDAKHALRLATRYAVVISPGIRARDGATLTAPVTDTFITQRPTVRRVWFHTWRSPVTPALIVSFDQPVAADSVARHLYLETANGKRFAVKVEQDPNIRKAEKAAVAAHKKSKNSSGLFSRTVAVLADGWRRVILVGRGLFNAEVAAYAGRNYLITPKYPLPPNTPVVLKDEAGIHSSAGPEPSVESRSLLAFQTFPAFRYLGLRCTNNDDKSVRVPPTGSAASNCNPQSGVTLLFSAPVAKEMLQQHLAVNPDLAGGRKDFDPWANVYTYIGLGRGHSNNETYPVRLPMWLKADATYRMAAQAVKIHDVFGRPLAEPIKFSFTTDHRRPDFKLIHTFSVLETGLQTALPVAVTNLNAITLSYQTLTTDGLQSGKTTTIPVYDAKDVAYFFPLKLRDLIPGESGAIQGQWDTVPSAADRYNYGELPRWFFSQVTPFQVHVKLGHFNTLVWVTRMDTGRPVAGAKIAYVIERFGAFADHPAHVAEAVTGTDGVAMLPGTTVIDPQRKILDNWRRSQPHFFVRVQKNKDLALLPLTYEFHVDAYGANSTYINSDYKARYGHLHAWGFTAQGVYKAGDTIQYKLYVRGQDNKRFVPAPAAHYTLKVVDPTGKTIAERKHLTLSSFGAVHGDVTVPKSGTVGWYHFELSADFTNETWEPIRVLVSDFTPASFHVRNDLNGSLFKPGDTMTVSTQATLHAGGPYVQAQTRVTVSVNAAPLIPVDPRAAGFEFDVIGGNTETRTLYQTDGMVDDHGHLTSTFKLPAAKDIVYGALSVESAVRDDRGKYVAARTGAHYVGRDRFVGIRAKDWVFQGGKPADFEAVVVNAQGKVTAGTPVTLVAEYEEVKAARVKSAGNAYLTQYVHKWRKVAQCERTSGLEPVSCRFTPAKPGTYRLIANIKDTAGRPHQSQTIRWAVGAGEVLWQSTQDQALQIIPEKPTYHVGDTARLLVKNPYPGCEALITVERYGVQRHWVKVLKNSTALVQVPITADSLPGIYVSVMVMSPRVAKPLGDNQVDLGKPTFRMGYAKIPVTDPAKTLKVSVKPAATVYKPGATVSVDIDGETQTGGHPPMEYAVAVLDESVFDLLSAGKNYYDPYHGFYDLDPLDVSNYNLLTRLIGIQKFAKKGANAGGDGGGDLSLRSVFKFVSYWNPSVKADRQGHARVSFKVPDNLTGWRVLVAAVTPDDLMGLGDGSFKVNQDTEIRAALPNQVIEGDHFEARFTVMNRTDKTRRLHVGLTAKGAVAGKGGQTERETRVTVAPFKRAVVGLPVAAGRAGDITFTVRAWDGRGGDALRTHLTVERQQALETAAVYGDTNSAPVHIPLAFPPAIRTDSGGISVVTAPTLIGGLSGAFKYMRDYPYICWEQKLTKGVMAARYRQLKAYLPKTLTWPQSDTLTETTLSKAADYQAPNGGMAYFVPSDRYADPYLSAYTALAFDWLRDAGYQVPAEVSNRLDKYLLTFLRRDALPDLYSEGMSDTVRAVALAALAGHGALQRPYLDRYLPHVKNMSLFGKAYFLMALTRFPDTAKDQRQVMDSIRAHEDESSGKLVFTEALDFAYQRILDSSLRTQCAVLDAVLDYEDPKIGAHPRTDTAAKLVRTITQTRKQRDHWENTQENMFCTNALVHYAHVYEKAVPDMTVTAALDGKSMGETAYHDFRDPPHTFERPMTPADPGRTATLTVGRKGTGRLYYAARLSYSPVTLKTTPINAGMDIRREYSVQRNGHWQLLHSPFQLQTGELVRVDLYLNLAAPRNFVVVDDPVPGGLEPVNRQLATASRVDADKAQYKQAQGSFWYRYGDWHEYGLTFWDFYHQELRHDSARFYADYLPAGRYHLAYAAQAVAPGSFTVLPVHAQEMYNPDVFGQGVPAVLDVKAAP